MGWLDTITKASKLLGGDNSSGGIGDFDPSWNFSSSYDNPDASFFEVPGPDKGYDIFSTPTVEQGGYDSNFNYGADPEGITQGGSAVGTTGGFTSTGGGAGSAIADLIKKYGLPALLAGLASKDRQKATGGGYGKAYQSPSPLTRTISQGKYGPIAKYAAEGGIIQGFNKGGSPRGSYGQINQSDVNNMVGGITGQFDPARIAENAKMVNAFSGMISGGLFPLIANAAQDLKAGNYGDLAKNTIKGMIPYREPGEKVLAGDFSGAAYSLLPPIVRAAIEMANNPSQSRQAADYASAFGNPEGTTPSSQAVQAADYASAFGDPEGTTSTASFPTQNTDVGQFRDMVTIAPTDDLGGYQPPPGQQDPMRGLDQGNDLGARNAYSGGLDRHNYEDTYGGMAGTGDISSPPPASTGYTGPSYGNHDSGVGSNFNDSSGPGEGGYGGGRWDGGNLSESGFGYGSGASMQADYGSSKAMSNRDDTLASLMSYAQGGGIAAMAKGRFLRGPGDGVSDSIPATIDGNQPAALADGEFVIPARVVSELGNGSSEAGARKLHAMMVRIQKDRRGAKNIAANTKVDRHLPA